MDPGKGLTQQTAESKLSKSGLNILPETPPTSDIEINGGIRYF